MKYQIKSVGIEDYTNKVKELEKLGFKPSSNIPNNDIVYILIDYSQNNILSWHYGFFNSSFKEITLEDFIKIYKKEHKMKVYKKKEMIIAMKSLAKNYINGTHEFGIDCPLCKTAEVTQQGDSNCKKCPWMIIKNKYCHRINKHEQLDRAKELLDWIKIYEDAEEISDFEPLTISFTLNTLEEVEFWYSICGNSNNFNSPGTEQIYNQIHKIYVSRGNEIVKCLKDLRAFKDVPNGYENLWEKYKEIKANES